MECYLGHTARVSSTCDDNSLAMDVERCQLFQEGPTEPCSVWAAHERSALGCVHEPRRLYVGRWVLDVCSPVRFDERPAVYLDLSLISPKRWYGRRLEACDSRRRNAHSQAFNCKSPEKQIPGSPCLNIFNTGLGKSRERQQIRPKWWAVLAFKLLLQKKCQSSNKCIVRDKGRAGNRVTMFGGGMIIDCRCDLAFTGLSIDITAFSSARICHTHWPCER